MLVIYTIKYIIKIKNINVKNEAINSKLEARLYYIKSSFLNVLFKIDTSSTTYHLSNIDA